MFTIRRVMVLALIFGVLLSGSLLHASTVTAQDTPAEAETSVYDLDVPHPDLAADCVRVQQLMDLPALPEDMIAGGGFLIPNTTVSSFIFGPDAGDRWTFATAAAADQEITFDFVVNGLELLVRIYRGMALIDRFTVPDGGAAETFVPPSAGYYTLVVSRMDVADLDAAGQYTITGSGDLAAGIEQGSSVSGAVGGPTNPRSQQWIFFNRLAPGQNEVLLELNIQAQQAARVRLLFDGELLEDSTSDVPVGRRTIQQPLTRTGYYVLSIVPQDRDISTDYTLSLASTGDPKNNAYTDGLLQPVWAAITGQPPKLALATDGTVSLQNESTNNTEIKVMPDAVAQITPSSSIRLELFNPDAAAGAQVPFFAFNNDNVQRIALLDGNLGVLINDPDAGHPVYFYIEDYPWNTQFTDTTGFRSIQLPAGDGRALQKSNRTVIEAVYMLPNCQGVKLTDGRRLIAEGVSLNLNLEAGQGGPDTPLTAQQIDILSTTEVNEDYLLFVNWLEIERIIASGGVITLDLTDERMVQVNRFNIEIVRDAANRFKIVERVAAASGSGTENIDLIATDWANMLRFLIDPNGTTFDVLDARGRIERVGRNPRQIQSEQGVIRVIWEDRAESLMLTGAEDFLQIETPAESAVYDPLAEPGRPGYLPVNANNVGQECYPVTTAFPFNCAPNGQANPANGNLSLSVTDLYARGYRLDLALSRTYNSLNYGIDGPFGYGWSADWLLDYNVLFDDDFGNPRARLVDRGTRYQIGLDLLYAPRGEVIVTLPTGSRHRFQLIDRNGVVAWESRTLPGWQIDLRANPLLDPWRVIRSDGLIYEFDLAGRLRQVEHPHGGALTISRESQYPAVYVISDDVGRSLRLEYDEFYHITRSSLLDGDQLLEVTFYSYDASGYLTQVIYGDGTTASYQYDDDGQLVAHLDPRMPQASELSYRYDPQHRLRAVFAGLDGGRDDALTLYEYGDPVVLGINETRITDAWGRLQVWEYGYSLDPATAEAVNYKLLRQLDASGQAILYNAQDNINPNLITNINPSSFRFVLNYEQGAILDSLISQSNGWINFDSSFETVTVGGRPVTALRNYRENGGNGPLGRGYTYDPATGQVLTIVESDETARPNDAYFNAEAVSTTIDERHPQFGLPTRFTVTYPPLPDAEPGTAPETETTTIDYDTYGYPAVWRDSRGTAFLTWDAFGRLTAHRFADAAGTDLVNYTIAYLPVGELATALSGNPLTLGAGANQCMVITDPTTSQQVYCYDERQRLIEHTITHQGTLLQRHGYTYDALDRLTEVREALSATRDLVTTYRYAPGSEAGTVWQVIETRPDGTTLSTEYDALDRVVAEVGVDGRRTTYAYQPVAANAQEEIVTQTYPNGTQRVLTYNLAGQLCTVTAGDLTYRLTYDQSCNIPRREVGQIGIDARLTVAYPEYYENGLPRRMQVTVNLPNADTPAQFAARTGARDNPVLQVQYDSRGRVVYDWNSAAGDRRSYTYTTLPDGGTQVLVQVDDFTRIEGTSQTSLTPYHTTTLTYDALDRLTRVENSEGVTTYAYDYDTDRGWLVVTVNADDTTWSVAYDAAGNLREWLAADGSLTVYEYDAASRLLNVTTNGTPVAQMGYDDGDRVIQMTDGRGLTQFTSYNRIGQVEQVYDFDGIIARYSYDPDGRLAAITDANGNATTYRYNPQGYPVSLTLPDGQRYDLTWSPANGTVTVSDGATSLSFHFDVFSRLWQIRDQAGKRHLFDYNADGRLAQFAPYERQDRSASYPFSFTYGAGDELLNISDNPELSSAGWNWQFGWNDSGHLISRTDPDDGAVTFDYDRLGRLTDLVTGEYRRSYAYDDQTVTRTTGGETTTYTYDDLYRALTLERSGGETDAFVSYSYDGIDIRVTDANGITTVYDYAGAVDPDAPFVTVQQFGPGQDPYGEQVYGSATRYIRDLRGDLVAIQHDLLLQPDGCTTADCVQLYRRTETLKYDPAGRPVALTNGENETTSYLYNQRGQLIAVRDPEGSTYRYSYDPRGDLVQISTPDDATLSLTYNDAGRLTSISRNGVLLESYAYTARGWLSEQRYPNYTADGFGRLTFRRSPAGRLIGIGVDNEIVNNADSTLTRSPDAFAWLTGMALASGETYSYAYDPGGQAIADSAEIASFTPDESGITVELGGLVYRLDSNLRLTQVEAGYAVNVTYGMDEANNDNLAVSLIRDDGSGRTGSAAFDRAGRLIDLASEVDDGSTPPVSLLYTYNDAGLPVRVFNADGYETAVTYDRLNRPLSVLRYDSVANLGGATYTYNAQGNREEALITTADGQTRWRATYGNPLDPMQLTGWEQVTPPARVALNFSAGLVLLAGGLTLAAVRSKQRRIFLIAILTGLIGTGGAVYTVAAQDAEPTPVPAAALSRLTYTYNTQGMVETITDAASPTATLNLSYDSLGRVTRWQQVDEVNPDQNREISFVYDDFGRLVEINDGSASTFYAYTGEQLAAIESSGEAAFPAVSVSAHPAILGNLAQAGEPDGFYYPDLIAIDDTFAVTYAGRLVDLRIGRYLQRDSLGPDASGNVYGYTPWRAQPVVQQRDPYPFMAALALLADQPYPQTLTADTVRTHYQPQVYGAWQHPGLEALATYNGFSTGQINAYRDLADWLTYRYNPPGVVVGDDGNFTLLDATHPDWSNWSQASRRLTPALPSPDALPFFRLAITPADLVRRYDASFTPPSWYVPDGWREVTKWSLATAAPGPLHGKRSPGVIDAVGAFGAPLTDLSPLTDLAGWLDQMPVEALDHWMTDMDAAILPRTPDTLPDDGAAWLAAWFTTDPIPVRADLREVRGFPSLPEPSALLKVPGVVD